MTISTMTPIEHTLAKQLAANELEPRMQALAETRGYLEQQSNSVQVEIKDQLSETLQENSETVDNLEKIWKGLFYCMWHSDKLPVQDELCETFSNLLHAMNAKNPGYQLLYVRAFFRTMSREWNGVDQYRINKFMRLVRFVLRQALVCFTKSGSAHLEQLFSVITEEGVGVIDWKTGNIENVPLGLKYHMIDIWIEEWKNVQFGLDIMNETDFADFVWPTGAYNKRFIDSEQTWQMLRPFVLVALRTKLELYRNRVYEDIFEILIEEADCSVDLIKQAPGLDEDEIKSLDNSPRLQISFEFLANRIMSCCNGKSEFDAPIKQTNRNRAYKLINRFKEVSQKHVPIPENTPDLTAINKLTKKMQKERKQRQKENQRYRKRLASEKPLEDTAHTSPKKKQKIKSCDELLLEEKDSGMEVEEDTTTQVSADAEIVLDTSKRDASRKKMKKQAKKRLKMYQQALALEEEREQEAEASRKAAVEEANRKSDLEAKDDSKSTRLSIRMDKCQVKYFDKKEKLKYETSDAYDPENAPTRSILKKRL